MRQHLALVALVARDYDEALAYYVGTLGFTGVEDRPVPEQGKRWVEDLYGNRWDLVQRSVDA